MSEVPPSPWDRYGWLMGAIWLVFLGFPIYAVAVADEPPWLRVVGMLAIAAFVVVYLYGVICLEPLGDPHIERRGLLSVAAMLALTAMVCVVGGGEGLGMLPFTVALAIFTIRAWWAATVAVAGIAAPLVLTEAGVFDQGTQFISLIISLVAAVSALVRVLEARESEQRVMVRELEIVAERERVARDVHDVLGHSLTVVATKAELAERLLDADLPRARDELQQIQRLTRQSLAEIRATVSGLRLARLDTELDSARSALAAAEIETEMSVGEVDPRHGPVLAWALREAVTNVVRHSGAGRCTIRIDRTGLSVSDDGRGLDGADEGNGLRGIRERVEQQGGDLMVAAGPDGRGTTVEVRP